MGWFGHSSHTLIGFLSIRYNHCGSALSVFPDDKRFYEEGAAIMLWDHSHGVFGATRF